MRRFFSNLLLFAGAAVLLAAALYALKSSLAARQTAGPRYLRSSASFNWLEPFLSAQEQITPTPIKAPAFADTPFPTQPQLTTPTPTSFSSGSTDQPIQSDQPSDLLLAYPAPDEISSPTDALDNASESKLLPTLAAYLPFVIRSADDTTPGETLAPDDGPVEPGATPSAPPMAESLQVVRLIIPRLKIDRAVVPLGLVPEDQGGFGWDTDNLFATRNRPDLVGHLITSAYPGQGANVVLVGHNYDQGIFRWKGVFVNLKSLKPGDEILVYTEDGQEFIYQVVRIKQIPWRNQNDAELEKHIRYMGESESEQLTLVTCGGANAWPWPARVYVVAVPVK